MKKLLEELFHTYYKDIYAYLYSLCRDAALSEDLTSEVFLEAVRSIVSFRGESDVRIWLFTIARRRWFAHLRSKNRQVPTLSLQELYDAQLPGTMDAETEAEETVRALLSREPLRTQQIVRMRLEGYSYFEIADACQISENSARVIWFRAKNKLKKQLQEEGFRYE